LENKYAVKLLSRAYCDLDGIYDYIAETLTEPVIASKLVNSLEEAIVLRIHFRPVCIFLSV